MWDLGCTKWLGQHPFQVPQLYPAITVPSMFHIHSYNLEGGQWRAPITVDSSSINNNNKYNINTAHVELKRNKSDVSNNKCNWNHLKITQTIPEQHNRKARNQVTTENGHTWHGTHTSQSTKVRTKHSNGKQHYMCHELRIQNSHNIYPSNMVCLKVCNCKCLHKSNSK